jgi:hypothetical protein
MHAIGKRPPLGWVDTVDEHASAYSMAASDDGDECLL